MSELAEMSEIEAGHLFELEFKQGMPERSFCIITDRKSCLARRRPLEVDGKINDITEAMESINNIDFTYDVL